MTAPHLISRDAAVVKAELLRSFASLVDPLLHAAETGTLTARNAEQRTWSVVIQIGAMLLTALFAALCRRETTLAVQASGLDLTDVSLRMDADYFLKPQSTFGRLEFPLFAFRDGDGKTHAPARRLFPLYSRARVTEVMLEWESALAADHPFRKAAEALQFFTHGAAKVEDTTIERHAVLVGRSVPQEWLYLAPEKVCEVLRDRASVDTTSGRPLIYVSTDAHALRLFEDETWAAGWKMMNGIRVWCKDRDSDATIHIGGEFTAGDCHEVVRRLHELDRTGLLPFGGDYGEGLVAQVVVVTDGLEWIAEHVVPLYVGALVSLDPYHVVEQVAEAARAALPKTKVRRVVQDARKALGMRERRGRTTFRKGNHRTLHRTRRSGLDGSGQRLIDEVLAPLASTIKRGKKRFARATDYVTRNLSRMNYGALRRRGAQIGSGAMESLHRTGSQTRLKRAGCRWTPDVAQAILNIRMLALTGRWNEYWAQSDLALRVANGSAD